MLHHLTDLQLAHLNKDFERDQDARIATSAAAFDLINKHQDDDCAVSEEIALQLMGIIHKYALVIHAFGEVCGLSLCIRNGQKRLMYSCVAIAPNKMGSYDATASTEDYEIELKYREAQRK